MRVHFTKERNRKDKIISVTTGCPREDRFKWKLNTL